MHGAIPIFFTAVIHDFVAHSCARDVVFPVLELQDTISQSYNPQVFSVRDSGMSQFGNGRRLRIPSEIFHPFSLS
jgi:hypothetical protein